MEILVLVEQPAGGLYSRPLRHDANVVHLLGTSSPRLVNLVGDALLLLGQTRQSLLLTIHGLAVSLALPLSSFCAARTISIAPKNPFAALGFDAGDVIIPVALRQFATSAEPVPQRETARRLQAGASGRRK